MARCTLFHRRHAIPRQVQGTVTHIYVDGAQGGVIGSVQCPRCGVVIHPMDVEYPTITPLAAPHWGEYAPKKDRDARI